MPRPDNQEARVPIYEYLCGACGKKSSFFTRSIGASLEPLCSHCGGEEMTRAISTFAYHRSLKTIHDSSSVPAPGAPSLDYYNDPRNIGRNVEETFRRHDVEMPESVRDRIDSARSGEVPEGLDL